MALARTTGCVPAPPVSFEFVQPATEIAPARACATALPSGIVKSTNIVPVPEPSLQTRRNLYWMRPVSFAALHRLLKAIGDAPDGLGPGEADDLMLRESMLPPHPRGEQPRPSTLYRYRNTLVRLSAVFRTGGKLRAHRTNPHVAILLDQTPTAKGTNLGSPDSREAFAALVLANPDCKAILLDLFQSPGASWSSVSDFRQQALSVKWSYDAITGSDSITFHNPKTNRMIRHTGQTAGRAVLYGLRYWLRDELALIDEYCGHAMDTTTLFPVAHPPVSEEDREVATQEAVEFLLSLRRDSDQGEWTRLSISDLIIRYCEARRRPRLQLFDAIDWLRREWAGHVSLVPAPLRLATIAAVSPQQEGLALRRYYKQSDGPYISHLSFHQDVTTHARGTYHGHA